LAANEQIGDAPLIGVFLFDGNRYYMIDGFSFSPIGEKDFRAKKRVPGLRLTLHD